MSGRVALSLRIKRQICLFLTLLRKYRGGKTTGGREFSNTASVCMYSMCVCERDSLVYTTLLGPIVPEGRTVLTADDHLLNNVWDILLLEPTFARLF